MSTDQPLVPRSSPAADGVAIAPDPAPPTAFRSFGRRLAAGVYGLLWVAAGLFWAAPLGAAPAAFAESGRETAFGLLLTTTPAAYFAVWGAMRTASSRLAHRRMMAWGAIAGAAALAGCFFFYQASEAARAAAIAEHAAEGARPMMIFAGLWEYLSALACGVAAGGCLTLALAGAWGRWVLHRGPDAATGDQ